MNLLSGIALDRTILANASAIALINLESIDLLLKVLIGIATLVWTGFRISTEISKRKQIKENKDVEDNK